jgi:hypothetical protein
LESERSSGAGTGRVIGTGPVDRPTEGCVLLGTGVRSRSISFARLIFGGGGGNRLKEVRLDRGVGDAGFF